VSVVDADLFWSLAIACPSVINTRNNQMALGARGPAWWDDGSSDLNRHMAKNYAGWYAKLARSHPGGL
jgi:hypothetical protein